MQKKVYKEINNFQFGGNKGWKEVDYLMMNGNV